MALILNIDTALENGFVSLSENDSIIAWQSSADQKEHASFLQPAVKQLMLDAGKKMEQLDAVAVTIGPGSYTGLRVGLASAKGLCYALQKPLIAINTLEVIALTTIEKAIEQGFDIKNVLFCAMIDARRMEVFTATYDYLLTTIQSSSAMILDEHSFLDRLETSQIIFSGNGTEKFKNVCDHVNAIFFDIKLGVKQLAQLATMAYNANHFSDIAYTEPYYVKSFYSTQQIKK